MKPLSPRARRAWRIVGLITLALGIGATIDHLNYPWKAPITAPIGNTRENGLWLRYTHYFGEKRDDELITLANDLKKYDIRWAYFHVRFIKKDGTLNFRYPDKARKMLGTLRKTNPNVKALAWTYAGNGLGEGNVDLTNPTVRATMVKEAVWLCTECGFDGIQWDYEICPNGDPNLLKLLEETRAALPKGKTIAVCAPAWLPFGSLLGWTEEYITQVSARCDQVQVMCYDTGFVTPRAYVWLTAQNVIRFTNAASPSCRIWLGVPTYGPGFRSHNPRSENLENSLRGAREGLAQAKHPERFGGIAPFADYTTDDDEWRTYQKLWQGKK